MKISLAFGKCCLAAVLICTACEAAPVQPVSPPPSSSVSTHIEEPVVPNELLNAARVALTNQPTGIALVGPRPSAIRRGDVVEEMTIRDQTRTPRDAGRYRLTVVCVGSGSLTVRFSIDDEATEGSLPQCSPNAAYYAGELTVPGAADAATVVQIVPAPGTVAGIGYRIDLVS